MVKVWIKDIDWEDASLGTGFIKDFYSDYAVAAVSFDSSSLDYAMVICNSLITIHEVGIVCMRSFPNLNLVIFYDREVPDRLDIDFSGTKPVLRNG